MGLSARLKKAAGLVSPGLVVADIGTDHAYLPIYLTGQGISPSALAMDVRPGPLKIAAANIKASGLTDRIRVRLSDGLKELGPTEAQSIVLAGMGGPLMCRILSQSPQVAAACTELICQPQSEIAAVRHYLLENGFRINAEAMVLDGGKYYQMFRACPCDRQTCREQIQLYEAEDYEYGKLLIDDGDPVLYDFLQKEQVKLKALIRQLEETGSGRAMERLSELARKLGRAEAALDRIRRKNMR